MATEKNKRSNNWSFVAYPESLPPNWEQIINQHHVQWFCSPLHDADLNADETEKKAHYHIIITFESLKSCEQVLEITRGELNATVPQIVKSMRGYLRYFVHLDNPEKHQYQISDIVCYGGADISPYFEPTQTDRYMIMDAMVDWIELNDITEFCDLTTYARLNEPEWRSLLYSNSTIFFSNYIKSRRNKKREIKTTDKPLN